MVNYTCSRCGYTTKVKTIFINHLNRKFTCPAKLNDISIEKIYNKYFCKKKKNVAHFDSISAQNDSKMTQNDSILLNLTHFFCDHCKRGFKRKSNLIRHLKSCKMKKEKDSFEDLKKLVDLLNEKLQEKDKELNKTKKEFKKELNKKDKQISELMKKTGVNIGTINQNIQNNIKILAYNKTDLTHLKDKDYMGFIKHANFCVPHMIKKLHFDPKKPENHNIYISNLKNNLVMTYDGKKWNIQDRNEVIDDMIQDKTCILEDKVEDWIERGKDYPIIMKKFNRYLEKKENDVVLNKIKQEIKFILFNNRKMVTQEE